MQLHKHSPDQQALLQELFSNVCQQLCAFVFSDPAKDEILIRAHAALMGKRELLLQLLQDDYPDPAMEQPQQPQPESSDDSQQRTF